MKTIRSVFNFTTGQQKGVLVLYLIIALVQLLYWFYDFSVVNIVSKDEKEWLAFQSVIDSMKPEDNKFKLQPFNPNFISDYKGYKLGMSIQEIDKLHAFRSSNRYVNSPKEFQNVTGVSDSLLNALSPYFKFPNWVNKTTKNVGLNVKFAKDKQVVKINKLDLNAASSEDLIKIHGIGEVLSNRILKFKEQLGGFVAMEQLKEIWGLQPEVFEEINKHFIISKQPQLHLIDINNASVKELSRFYYFRHALAKQIVMYRSMNGDIRNNDDLIKIKDFPVEKAKIIALYLKY